MSERIAVIGAGAIGGITAALMAKAGLDVTLVCKHPDITAQARDPGLQLTGFCGEQVIPLNAVTDIAELSGTYDLCLIATKAYDMPDAARRMLPLLREDSLVVSMQNGICTDDLAAAVGIERTVGCVIGWGATMHSHGRLEMTSGGDFVIGMPHGLRPPRLEALKAALEAVVPTRISEDIFAELYSKLIVNSCITSLGAVCGLTLGEMMKRNDARKIFLAVIFEAMDVARAIPVQVPPYGGKLDYYRLIAGTSALDRLRRHLTIRVVGLKYSRLKSSSLQSLERGRPTEINWFNGYIAARGQALDVPCPVNARLTAMIREIEQGKRRIGTENLQDSAFASL